MNFELIIVDAGSTDTSREIASEFASLDPRVKLIFEKDKGPADGLNKGLSMASGAIVGCLNSDDFYLPGIFRQVVWEFLSHPDVDCIYSHGLILQNGKLRFQSSDKFDVARYFSNRGLVLQQSTFFRLSTLKFNQISFNPANKTSWDGEFLVDLARSGGKFRRVLGKWGVFRIYDESITGSGKFRGLAELDNKRILKVQESLGFKMSLVGKILLRVRLFSLYRRFRNVLLCLILAIVPKREVSWS
jgi:glycosyltransferase involved in cell wall biosynthesis